MLASGLVPSRVTYLILLDGFCKSSEVGHIEFAKKLFHELEFGKWEGCAQVALIGMYAKCGNLSYAERGIKALDIFHRMLDRGLEPNQTTFSTLLSACSHSGLVEQGRSLFLRMEHEHNIKRTQKHYACYVDLLSRAGHLEEAEELV
ncbi:hypothetical protein V6N12_023320 [Hibiscus sabdariffa]|uniref:Pentatricopeptide repeat-containing protein n=1 Tax=Hibiscus sabdariffa TaxID=183260 RepID=A0ABR2FXQ2_9ROSI